jgi:hypothetical protein
MAEMPAPREPARARVVMARENGGSETILAGTPWQDVRRLSVGPRVGQHEGLGGVAIAAAAGLLAGGDTREVLVIGLSKARGHALLLAAP